MNKLNSKVLDLAQNIGSFIEYWGFKEVHGRVWTLIFLSKDPVDANFLKTSLNISKALTSMTIKDLLYYNVILEIEKDKPGTQRYKANPDITEVILDVLKNRELKLLYSIKKDFAQFDQGSSKGKIGFDGEKIKSLGLMIHSAVDLLEGMTSFAKIDFQKFEEVTQLKY